MPKSRFIPNSQLHRHLVETTGSPTFQEHLFSFWVAGCFVLIILIVAAVSFGAGALFERYSHEQPSSQH